MEPVCQGPEPAPGQAGSAAASPDGHLLAIPFSRRHPDREEDHGVLLWDVATRVAVRTIAGNSGRTRAVAFSPGGEALACAGEPEGDAMEGELALWDARTGKPL